jgi:hypothetical protein
MAWFFGIACLGLIITICFIWADVANGRVYDQQIAMYEEENKQIETDIDTIVQNYMAHESSVYKDVKPGDNVMTLVTLFPELKSDELVSRQISLYISNNYQIKQLKEEKIRLEKKRWLLCFG